MAQGPDPNRHPETDPSLSADEVAEGGGPGDPDFSRVWLPTWAVPVLTVVIAAVVLFLLLG